MQVKHPLAQPNNDNVQLVDEDKYVGYIEQ